MLQLNQSLLNKKLLQAINYFLIRNIQTVVFTGKLTNKILSFLLPLKFMTVRLQFHSEFYITRKTLYSGQYSWRGWESHMKSAQLESKL